MKADKKLHCHSHSRTAPTLRRVAVVCAFAVMAGLGRAAQHAPAPPPVAPQMTHEIQFVKSVFVATPGPGFGTDPFFPKTARLQHVRTNSVAEPGPVSFLSLNGISGTRNHRLAIINYKTFEVGEEAEVKINAQPFRVRCLEIRDDGVSVRVNGQVQKLFLAPKR